MAVREGFEPSIRVNVYTLSRRAPSATRTPHRSFKASVCEKTVSASNRWRTLYHLPFKGKGKNTYAGKITPNG